MTKQSIIVLLFKGNYVACSIKEQVKSLLDKSVLLNDEKVNNYYLKGKVSG